MKFICFIFIIFSIKAVQTRGRYEFIEDADLPAFYSMRSAQMAQKAQLIPSQLVPEYNPYYPYQVYQQPSFLPEPNSIPYNPFSVYNPIYRQPTPSPSIPFSAAARAPPVHYHPFAYFHGLPSSALSGTSGIPAAASASPIRKKSF